MMGPNPFVRTTIGAYLVNHDRHHAALDVPLYAVLDADVQLGHGADVAIGVLESRASRIHAAIQRGQADARRELEAAVIAANTAVLDDALTPEWRGCGSTVTCCTLTDAHVVVAHVGDSRLYVRHDAHWSRITTDHTLVEQLRQHGTPEALAEAKEFHPNVIVRALGFVPEVEVDTVVTERCPGDCLLLCTDGAWRVFDPDMTGEGPDEGPEDPAELLAWIFECHAASGGRSNATAMLVPL